MGTFKILAIEVYNRTNKHRYSIDNFLCKKKKNTGHIWQYIPR